MFNYETFLWWFCGFVQPSFVGSLSLALESESPDWLFYELFSFSTLTVCGLVFKVVYNLHLLSETQQVFQHKLASYIVGFLVFLCMWERIVCLCDTLIFLYTWRKKKKKKNLELVTATQCLCNLNVYVLFFFSFFFLELLNLIQ